nr:hypothetical protein CFP56_57433 [Quercus suber]
MWATGAALQMQMQRELLWCKAVEKIVSPSFYTVLGGVDNGTGAPIFIREKWFLIFVISDAAALFSSSASIIMFLSILTSCYAENDFLITLPARLMFGLGTVHLHCYDGFSLYCSNLYDL